MNEHEDLFAWLILLITIVWAFHKEEERWEVI